METSRMKIEYRKQIDSETAPWQLLTNINELLWNGVYNLRVTDDDGTHNLPFSFANDDTVTLIVKDHAHEGMLENGRTIVQTITRVERNTGIVLSYTRTRCSVNGTPTWSYWTLATEGNAVIDIPKATQSSLGGVIVGDGLAVDADGRVTVAEKSIGEGRLTDALNDKINEAAVKANVTDLFVQNDGLILHYGALRENEAPYAGTDFRVHTDKILSAGELLTVNSGYVISAFKIFEGGQEIAYAGNLSETQYPLDAHGLHYQFEFCKLNTLPFTNDELSQVIKAFHRQPIVWSSAHHINNYVAAGTYCISGEHMNADDGLPIANAASGHTFHARLLVLDSSIAGSGKESDKCITQILAFSNRVGNDSNIYVRTGRAADTAHLIAGNGWGTWGKLQQNVEVGQTTSLNGYIDNGIYSGVYTNGSAPFETFVMVVLNNYAVAVSTGVARSITQVKYGVGIDGSFTYMVRTGQGTDNVEWGEWRDLDIVTTDRVQDGAVTADKLSADIREKVYNPLRPLYIAAGAEYNDSGADKTKTAPWGETVTHKAGCYYLNGLGDITEMQMVAIYNASTLRDNLHRQRYAHNAKVRTLLPFTGERGLFLRNIYFSQPLAEYVFNTASNVESVLEVFALSGYSFSFIAENLVRALPASANVEYTFNGCKALKAVCPIDMSATTNAAGFFANCIALRYAYLSNLKTPLSFSDSALIEKASVLYAIVKAAPTSAITIILHPDAYARLADDAEIVAALEAQSLISLVSA